MTKNMKTLIAIAAFVIFMIAAGIIYNSFSERYQAKSPLPAPTAEASQTPDSDDMDNSSPEPGEEKRLEAPDFSAVDGDGNEVRLQDFRGTPVVLNFWASWCSQCRKELPALDRLFREYSEDGLVVLVVDLVDGARETMDSGKKYVEENGFAFKVLYDTRQEAAYTYGVRFIPSTLFIDKDGYILAGYEGPLGEEGLRIGIDLLLDPE
ncbi:MAG: TlpA family protein disulfide reductase [Clostridiaceae bacterium]|jgi:cytochrome c biogenesis protein CcmG/thiol:disulfide interchange protein DsbE|nr:TlpA family protein disulfide reductase [Clostridiaceae bacterium]